MVTPTSHVIAGPDLNRAGPLALWGFLQDLSAKYRGRPKKVLQFEREAPAGTAQYYGKSGPGYGFTFIKRLDGGLR